jgi:probable 2-oxoglutarate dehydrogenase E1 component DHKTD1
LKDKLSAKRVILLSGKIYYEVLKERQSRNLNDSVALVRIEELALFPFKELEEALRLYTNATEYMWLQEEH